YYSKLGAEKSWLGFPSWLQQAHPQTKSLTQDYEGGTVYWQPRVGPIAVPTWVIELIRQDGTAGQQLGFPVTEETSLGTGESDRIQFFENGVVTLRDGKNEMWVRPDSNNG